MRNLFFVYLAFKYSPFCLLIEQFTPLSNELLTRISMRGPITLHDYMSMALNHPLYGYYHNKIDANNGNDKIGERGDFITAPVCSN